MKSVQKKKVENTQFNVYWYCLIPVSGKCTINDCKQFEKVVKPMVSKNTFVFYVTGGLVGREKIDFLLKSLTGTLSKKYSVLVITDAQFGLLHKYQDSVNPFFEVATTMQKQSIFQI